MFPISLLSWLLVGSAPPIPLDLDYTSDGRCVGRQPIVMVEVVELKTDEQRRVGCRVRVTDVIRGSQILLGLKMSEYTLKDNELLLKIGDVGLWRLPSGTGGPVLPDSVVWKRLSPDFDKAVELAIVVAALEKQSPLEQSREVRKWLQAPNPLVANWAVGALKWDWSPQTTALLAEMGKKPPKWLTAYSALDQALCSKLGESWLLGADRRKLLVSCVEANTPESWVVVSRAQAEFTYADRSEEERIRRHRNWQGRYTPDLAVELLLTAVSDPGLSRGRKPIYMHVAVLGIRLGARPELLLDFLVLEINTGRDVGDAMVALARLVRFSAGDNNSKPNPLSPDQITVLRKLADLQKYPALKKRIAALADDAELIAAKAEKK
jgi:hypothetical protein